MVRDENDCSGVANALPAGTLFPALYLDNVMLMVQMNSHWAAGGVQSRNFHNSYSLLMSIEAGLSSAVPEPCLRQQCADDVRSVRRRPLIALQDHFDAVVYQALIDIADGRGIRGQSPLDLVTVSHRRRWLTAAREDDL